MRHVGAMSFFDIKTLLANYSFYLWCLWNGIFINILHAIAVDDWPIIHIQWPFRSSYFFRDHLSLR